MKSLIRNIFLGLSLLMLFASILAFIDAYTLDDATKAATAKNAIAGLIIFSFMFALPYFLISKNNKTEKYHLVKTILLGISLFMLFSSIVTLIDSTTMDNITKSETTKSASLGLLLLFFMFALLYLIIVKNTKIQKNRQGLVEEKQQNYSKPIAPKIGEIEAVEKPPPPSIKEFKACRNCSSSEIEIKDEVYICSYCGTAIRSV